MAKFAITWTLGRVETVDQDSAETVEEFTNIHFGSMWTEAQEAGVTIELVTEPAPEAPAADTAAEPAPTV